MCLNHFKFLTPWLLKIIFPILEYWSVFVLNIQGRGMRMPRRQAHEPTSAIWPNLHRMINILPRNTEELNCQRFLPWETFKPYSLGLNHRRGKRQKKHYANLYISKSMTPAASGRALTFLMCLSTFIYRQRDRNIDKISRARTPILIKIENRARARKPISRY